VMQPARMDASGGEARGEGDVGPGG
jgi:hypothetical protein